MSSQRDILTNPALKLCFGGSFNPIHNGHLICARAAAEALGFCKVVLIPSRLPPHKTEVTTLASAGDRLEMCRLAVEGDPLFEVDDLELHRTGPSYTIDTARELRKRGWKAINWLIGGDMLAILPQWHEAKALIEEVNFVIMGRPGWEFDWSSLPGEFARLKANVVQGPLIQIGATEIRQRVAQGRSIDYLAPKGIVDYIRERGLYRR